jgi:hypothetical protein
VPGRTIDDWVDRFRMACQGCTNHMAGPVVSWSTMLDELDPPALRAVGLAIARASEERLRTTHDPAIVRREVMVLRFVGALFGLT